MFITHVRRHEERKKVDLKLLNAWGSRKTRESVKQRNLVSAPMR